MGILKGAAEGYRGDKKKLNEKKSQKVAISNLFISLIVSGRYPENPAI